ncbi:MAG: DUF4221 family protein [Bacteroidota bacterium]
MRYSLIFLFVLLACQDEGNVDHWILKQRGQETYPLDSTTGFHSYAIQLFNYNGQGFLAIGNRNTDEINIYNRSINDHSLAAKLPLATEGPNALGTTPWAFHIVNFDTIFVLSHWEGILSQIDSSGTVFYKKLLTKNSWKGDPHPWAGTSHPMLYNAPANTISVPGVVRLPGPQNYSGSYAMIDLNYVKDTFSYSVSYPKIYDTGFWHQDGFTKGPVSKSLKGDVRIASFGIDPYIRFSDGDSSLASSEYLREKFVAPAKRYTEGLVPENSLELLYLQGCYRILLPDPYRKVYYRFVDTPLSLDAFEEGVRDFRTSIIILDENFKKQGETLLPKSAFSYMFYLAEDGLYIANREAYYQKEDVLTFDRYILEK